MGMPKLKIARVYWKDATHYRAADDVDWLKNNAQLTEFITVGHVLKMGRDRIILAHEINDDGSARDTTVLNRKDVSRIDYLE